MLALLSILLLGLTAVAHTADPLGTQAAKEFSDGNFKFCLDLYKRLAEPGKNLVTSSLSVSVLLSMLLSGSNGRTYDELQTALGYDSLTRGDLHSIYPSILKALQGNGSYDLSLANSEWMLPSLPVLNDYQQVVSKVYRAEIKPLNIETSKEDINGWVKNKTNGMIPELLGDNLTSDVVMVLLNAIFFKGKWAQQFENKTFEAGFLDNDIEIPMDDYPSPTTRMMRVKGDFEYSNSNDLNAYLVDIPYEGDVSMTIVLPSWKLSRLEANLTSENLQNAIKQMRKRKVSIVMPVFKIESSLKLKQQLMDLGVKDLFSDGADLSNIVHGLPLKVSNVFQKAKIEVSVEGTKAAAATGAIVITKSQPIFRYEEFRATHPFMFLLRHKPTNTILFVGRYTQSEPFQK